MKYKKQYFFIFISIMFLFYLIYLAINSDFAKLKKYEEKNKIYREKYNFKNANIFDYFNSKMKKNSLNPNLLSLGEYKINYSKNKNLTVKLSLKTDSDTVNYILDNENKFRKQILNRLKIINKVSPNHIKIIVKNIFNADKNIKYKVDEIYIENLIY